MPAAFRELFESFMNVCISLLILSLFAWQALASLLESLRGEMSIPSRTCENVSMPSVTTNFCRCLKVWYVCHYHYFDIPGPCLVRTFLLQGSHLIAFDKWLRRYIVRKSLVVRTGVAFGSGNPGLQRNLQTQKERFWIPKKGVGWKMIFDFQGKMVFKFHVSFFFLGKMWQITSSFFHLKLRWISGSGASFLSALLDDHDGVPLACQRSATFGRLGGGEKVKLWWNRKRENVVGFVVEFTFWLIDFVVAFAVFFHFVAESGFLNVKVFPTAGMVKVSLMRSLPKNLKKSWIWIVGPIGSWNLT